MATLTLNYDGRNKTARSIVEMLRSLDIFSVSEPKSKPRKADPTLMSEEEFFAKIERAEQQAERGEYSVLLPGEDLTTHLRRMGYAI